MVGDLSKDSLVHELHLMRDNVAGSRCPVRREAIISGDPFRTDVSVHRNRVRTAICGRGGKGHVGEWKRLLDQVRRLPMAVIV